MSIWNKNIFILDKLTKIIFRLIFFCMIIAFLQMFNLSVVMCENEPELITDRPDVTESATVVPMKTLQIESGFVYESILRSPSQDLTLITFNSTLLRYGVSKSIELRLGFEYLGSYNNNKILMSEVNDIGTGPLYLGMKIQVTKENRWVPEIAAIPGLILPFTAYRPFQSDYIEPELVLSFSNTLKDWLSLGYNIGSVYFYEDKSFLFSYSIALGAELPENFGTYIELNSYFSSKSNATHYFNGGIVFLPVYNLQLDLSGGFGLNSSSSDFHWGFGFSWRIPE